MKNTPKQNQLVWWITFSYFQFFLLTENTLSQQNRLQTKDRKKSIFILNIDEKSPMIPQLPYFACFRHVESQKYQLFFPRTRLKVLILIFYLGRTRLLRQTCNSQAFNFFLFTRLKLCLATTTHNFKQMKKHKICLLSHKSFVILIE